MRFFLVPGAVLLAVPLAAQKPAAPPRPLPAAEQAAIFQAAGAVRRGRNWVICTEDRSAAARLDEVRDINGDGRPEAIVAEDGLFCHGNTGTGFVLLSKQANGRWLNLLAETGIPQFLRGRGPGGWPDLSIGGPGFCFPVLRWNGRAYVQHRREYEGKPCR